MDKYNVVIHAKEYYLSIERNEIWMCASIWVSLENIWLSKRHKAQNTVCVIWFSLDEKSTTGKFIETEYRFLATKSASDWKKQGIIAHVEFYWLMTKFYNLTGNSEVNLLKSIELDILGGWNVWYVSYISTKLLYFPTSLWEYARQDGLFSQWWRKLPWVIGDLPGDRNSLGTGSWEAGKSTSRHKRSSEAYQQQRGSQSRWSFEMKKSDTEGLERPFCQ